MFYLIIKLSLRRAQTHPHSHTPSQAPPPSDWWHRGQSLSSSRWSGWKWFSLSGHPSGPNEREKAETQRKSTKTSNHQHQVCHSTFKYLFDCNSWGKAVKECEQTPPFNFSLFYTLFLSVPSSLASRCLHTLCDCICNSGRAITQSLQIFRGVIEYNVAWKWLRAGKAFFLQVHQSSQCCSNWKPGTSGPIFSQMSGSHRSGSYSLSTDNCAGKHLSYYFDSESECLSIDTSAVHRNKDMLLQWRIIMNDSHRGWGEAYLSTVEAS